MIELAKSSLIVWHMPSHIVCSSDQNVQRFLYMFKRELLNQCFFIELQSVERAMAVVAMIGWGKDCDPYPKPETLMKYRAMIEGMPEYELDGSPSDPKEFLGEANYKYLMHWHTKKMSSTRGEFAGVKGVRGIFAQHEHFNMDLCKSDQQTAEMKAKGEELLKGG